MQPVSFGKLGAHVRSLVRFLTLRAVSFPQQRQGHTRPGQFAVDVQHTKYTSLKGRYTNVNIVRALKEINNNVHILASEELPNIRKNMKEYQYHNPAVEVEYLDYVKELPQLEAPEKVLDYLKIYM